MSINSIAASLDKLMLQGTHQNESRSSLISDLKKSLKEMLRSMEERSASLRESLIAGNDEALKHCIQYQHENWERTWRQIPQTAPWPIVAGFFRRAQKVDPERAFDLVEEILLENPSQALNLYEEMTTSQDHYGIYRFEFILLQNDVIKDALWRYEDYEKRLIDFVDRTGEMPPPSMMAAFLLSKEQRVEAEISVLQQYGVASHPLIHFQKVMFRCSAHLRQDLELNNEMAASIDRLLCELPSVRMRVALSHYFFDNFPKRLESLKARSTILDILRRAEEVCPGCFQITLLKVPEL